MNFEQQSMWNRLQGKPGNYYSEAAEPEREAFRQFMKGLLWDGPVLIEFEKKDGSVRVMNCTLNSTFGAVYKDKIVDFGGSIVEVQTPKKSNQNICAVWDINQQSWRSFRWDRLKRIEFHIG